VKFLFRDEFEASLWRMALLAVASEAPKRNWRECFEFADRAVQEYRDRVWDPDGTPDDG
jgi:hypothetical protein